MAVTLEPGSFDDWFVLMDGHRYVSDACVEGNAEEWRAILAALEAGEACSFKRCAMHFIAQGVEFWSPRNSVGRPWVCTRAELPALIESIRAAVAPAVAVPLTEPVGAYVAAPTRDEIERAWAVCRAADMKTICDLSLGSVAEVVRGSPSHEPTRYSDAEIRLARAVLVLRAALVEVTRERDEQGRQLDALMVMCPGCSEAGGAGLPVRHLPPICEVPR